MRIDHRGTTLSVGRLLLRPWHDGDIPAIVAAYRDPAVRAGARAPVTGEPEARRWLELQDEGRESGIRHSFAVVEGADDGRGGEPVGNVTLKYPDPGSGRAEVGYWTVAGARGRGIAPRALGALTDWAFTVFADDGLVRLDLLHQVDNAASCRVAEKSGYALVEVLPAVPSWPQKGHRHRRCAPASGG
ncbi:GNAT family N-acetyltransferase [Streptomyces sp. AM 4-1-1]|uniref:GNAT family N-acetyltransferase n=1 Tax=Streptomyces sp. AM 4-1-1 TaxID=3028710 RepID=UPI0023BA29B5|nr:GNAT family N-acetyltransferase [Streptomyces sp. AM 4-1-1]WEH33697.1 GNAT family N-acetyltransferase [Streptomyces sp. AM 4-1-1]